MMKTALENENFVVTFDGASKGNPGPSSYGFTIAHARLGVVHEAGRRIPDGTNNVAEYTGIIDALRACEELGIKRVEAKGDSMLVVMQMRGEWRVNRPHLAKLRAVAANMHPRFTCVKYTHVPRAENSAADALGNRALRLTVEESKMLADESMRAAKLRLAREFDNKKEETVKRRKILEE